MTDVESSHQDQEPPHEPDHESDPAHDEPDGEETGDGSDAGDEWASEGGANPEGPATATSAADHEERSEPGA